MFYDVYRRPSKPLPNWLNYLLFWVIIPPAIIAVMVFEMIKEGQPARRWRPLLRAWYRKVW